MEKVAHSIFLQSMGLDQILRLRKWLAAYKEFGDEGLKRSRKKENYSFEKEAFCCRVIFIK